MMGGGILATFSLNIRPSYAFANLDRVNLYDTSMDLQTLLEFFLDYIYHLESSYFKILGLTCQYEGSNMSDLLLQSVGFFQTNYGGGEGRYFHLNPNFLEELNIGTQNEEIKNIFYEKYNKYLNLREKFIIDWKKTIEEEQIILREYETKECNNDLLQSKRQWIEKNNSALVALESKEIYRLR